MMRGLMLWCALVMPLAAAEGNSKVRFSNSDMLPGSIGSLSADHLMWESPLLAQPASFPLAKVLDLTLPAEQPAVSAKHEASIALTNGDVLRGQLAGVSPDVVELDTWYAGRLKVNRLMISKIDIAERQNSIYRGPVDLEGWKQSGSRPAWMFRNAGFRSVGGGSIARDVGLPDECSISFDAEWRNSLAFKVIVFSNDITSDRPSSGYEITFAQRSVFLRSCRSQKFLGSSGNAVSLQQNEKARIEIRASLSTGKVCLLVDDEAIENWTDPDAPAGTPLSKCGGLHFVSTGQNGSSLQISRIQVDTWDGETVPVIDPQRGRGWNFEQGDEPDEPQPAKPEVSPDRMELRNGDSISGEVTGVQDDMISIKTPFRDVKLPIESLRRVALKPANLERCKRENGDVRAWFPDGSSVVFRLEEASNGKLTGSSQNFEKSVFKQSAFSRIEFNIYEPTLEEIRSKSDW